MNKKLTIIFGVVFQNQKKLKNKTKTATRKTYYRKYWKINSNDPIINNIGALKEQNTFDIATKQCIKTYHASDVIFCHVNIVADNMFCRVAWDQVERAAVPENFIWRSVLASQLRPGWKNYTLTPSIGKKF